ncbi:indole-3-glycerol-phosphate synthase [Vulcanisaeta thermophila]|uniref:indole-3-glycerol-phosphate synthase n=1 Tax=Vulcanisaeta thermophila TaxID=867917 RepID=UPI000852EE0D|nr:indole-3-glycerol-phosphate synthase [Vulcanisaeta thermophila]
MQDFLSHIGELTRMRINALRGGFRAPSLRRAIEGRNAEGFLALIGEYKRASPSGVIQLNIDPWTYFSRLRDYVAGFSVLVEPIYFLGSPHLVSIAVSFGKPVLYKDFVISREQVNEASGLGASAVLLITRLLGEGIGEFIDYSRRQGLEPLVEVDNLEDALRVLDLDRNVMLGINSRDLGNLSVSIARAVEIIRGVRSRADLIIAESGVNGVREALELARAGANAVLVGTALMKKPELAVELSGVRLA